MNGFSNLGVHSDVPPGIRTLAASGARLVTLSNGSSDIADKLLSAAGIRNNFARLLSADDAAGWKPMAAAYDYAAHACEVERGEILMIAVHPWDIHGAARAGLKTAWINREATTYPSYFAAPDFSFATINDLALELTQATR